MNTIIKSYEKGFSKETIILPTFKVQSAFFRNPSIQTKQITNHIRKEIVELNNVQADIKHGALIYSEMLKMHQHSALKGIDEDIICASYDAGSEMLKACKSKSNYTITEVAEGLKKFATDLSPEKTISVTKKETNKTNTFSIFSTLKFNSKAKTISFKFSEEYITFLNSEECPLTYIQLDDFKKVASNKTGGTLFFMIQSISNLTKKKFFLTKYLIESLGLVKSPNKLLNNAFENLKEKGFLEFEKVVSCERLGNNKWLKSSIYRIKDIFKKVIKSTEKTAETLKVPTSIEINSKLFNSKKGREIFNELINGKEQFEVELDAFNTDYLDFVGDNINQLVSVKY